jgi:hypothetical protein
LGSRTSEIPEIPRNAIQVQNRAGTGTPSVGFDPIEGENLAFGVLLDPDREALWSRITGEAGLGRIQLPRANGLTEDRGHRR